MNRYYDSLIQNYNFSEQDAKELADIIIREEKVSNANKFDFVKAYSVSGMRWTEKEIVEYMNMGYEDKLTLEECMNCEQFYKLSSGLIVSWNY